MVGKGGGVVLVGLFGGGGVVEGCLGGCFWGLGVKERMLLWEREKITYCDGGKLFPSALDNGFVRHRALPCLAQGLAST